MDAMYLSGHRLDPESAALRAALTSPPPADLDPTALVADLGFFREILERYCIGYDRLLRHPDYDPDDFFARWRERISGVDTIGIRAALVPEMTALQGFAPNSHLTIVGTGPSARPRSAHRYRFEVIADTALITITGFQQLDAFVADYPAHAAHPRIGFDLRGNNGGNLSFMMRWLAQAKPSDWQSYGYDEVVAPCLRWNQLVASQIRAGTVDTLAAVRARAELPDVEPGMRRFDGIREGYGSAPYQGNVVVLVDRHTGSSGEKAAIELQRALGATLVGEPTAGAMQYAEGVQFVLPRTSLVVTLPTKRADYGAEVEGTGWPVDVPFDPERPAIELINATDR